MSTFNPMLNELYHKERLQDRQRQQRLQSNGVAAANSAQRQAQRRPLLVNVQRLISRLAANSTGASSRKAIYERRSQSRT